MVFGRLIGDKLKQMFGIYNFLVFSVVGSLVGSLRITVVSPNSSNFFCNNFVCVDFPQPSIPSRSISTQNIEEGS